MNLIDAFAAVMVSGVEFSADDVTAAGTLALDPSHAPNAGQNGIGSIFNDLARRQLIEFTGRIVRSTAPRRKGGAIRVWRPTPEGVRWAQELIDA